MWNQASFSVELVEKGEQYILTRITFHNKKPFLFSAIYANPRLEKRKELWDTVRRQHAMIQEPWMLAGDFNDIVSTEEKRGGAPVDLNVCATFGSVLDNCQLLDLGYSGPLFTWKGPKFQHLDRVFKRLDRVVANAQWRMAFDEAVAHVIPRVYSDHCPIILSLDKDIFG
ncbi:uncharacterized protein LOC133296317 [Gastrolobium bilobum]|uniref:uncharacterized protein LOC133296317 n=1 Tax=Gastrolobium bilobum TaxID=150636 RepID=UPI002AB20400|nr:uncharacterized protein LOC133296317 [Gastrolobium bilobum]